MTACEAPFRCRPSRGGPYGDTYACTRDGHGAGEPTGAVYDRYHVYIGGRPILHTTAARDWVCGQCESPLVTRCDPVFGWITVCAASPAHDPDRFITKLALDHRVNREMIQADNMTIVERRISMGLKDRDTAYGQPQRLRLSRVGRVRQGIVAKNKAGKDYPKAVDYFILDPLTDNQTERAQILDDVWAAIDAACPGQDRQKPTVLPIVFLAGQDDIIAPESYKVRRGRAGTVWCAGDGETIHWKLDDDFRIEVASGARADTGEIVPCPGGSKEDRHPWCSECAPELELNFAILGYERTGTWMIRTSSMSFRDQLWTQIGLVRALADAGLIPGLVGVPFLLRRRKEMITAPVESKEANGDGPQMTPVEMPLTTIEVLPAWFQRVMRRSPVLQSGMVEAIRSLTATAESAPDPIPDHPSGTIPGETLASAAPGRVLVTPAPSAQESATSAAARAARTAPAAGAGVPASGAGTTTGNGKPQRQAALKVDNDIWQAVAAGLAAGEAFYRLASGKPDLYKMTVTAAKCAGVSEITATNLADVIASLQQYAVDMRELAEPPQDACTRDGCGTGGQLSLTDAEGNLLPREG
jgi:hypothetical protein